MTTYYHVAGEKWAPGDDLLCWDALVDQGVLTKTDWKWIYADVGADGGKVCLYRTLAEAEEHREDWGGTILAVTIPSGSGLSWTYADDEGYDAIHWSIPAEYIEIVS